MKICSLEIYLKKNYHAKVLFVDYQKAYVSLNRHRLLRIVEPTL